MFYQSVVASVTFFAAVCWWGLEESYNGQSLSSTLPRAEATQEHFQPQAHQTRASKCLGGSFILSAIRLHYTAPSTSFHHWFRTQPYTSLSLKDWLFFVLLLFIISGTLHIYTGPFIVYSTCHVHTDSYYILIDFIIFLFKLLLYSFRYLSIIFSIFWDLRPCCYLLLSILLWYLWISPKWHHQ